MATTPFPNPFSLAPQKLAQIINPLYWLTSGTGQIGFVNINGTASANPEVEAEIVEKVATYGRQLGRISDVLDVVLRKQEASTWNGQEKKAFDDFKDMIGKIAAVKEGYLAPTQANVDKLIDGINSLKKTNEPEYQRIKDELKAKLFGPQASRPLARARARR